MRTCSLIALWLLLLASCKEISFKEPQPAGVPALTEIPANLQGHYLSYDEITGEESDTLIIESWGYHFKDKEDKDWLGSGHLSDSLVVKFYQNYYFINFKSGDQWVLRLVRQKPYGGIEFLSIDIQDDAKRKEMLRKISRKLDVKEIHRDEDTFYQIRPTAAQLMQLIKEGYFTGPELSKVK
ncbi:MAG TPA: hypothetical protein PKJ63_03840 [Cyclobacteriaceae bacterium]|nr:hypothetical protein [Cyclobacteriaceae bacterium]